MAVDYDLIILGATPAGIQSAIAAATLKARVALLTQGDPLPALPEALPSQALLHLAQISQTAAAPLPAALATQPPTRPDWQWARVDQWLEGIRRNVAVGRSETALAYQGVDVSTMPGVFCRKPALGVRVGDRVLQARGYLLAMGARPAIPSIAGLEAVGYLTADQVPAQLERLSSLKTVFILGNGKTAVELAQTLVAFGLQLILVTQQPTLLPQGDRELTQLIQAQLEAAGVQLWLQTTIDQVRSHQGQKQLLIGNTVLSADEIILAAGHAPDLKALQLEAIGVQWDDRGVRVKPTLQTTHPRIYACEGRVGRECDAAVASAEAAIALKNILYFPVHRINYPTIPMVLHSPPAAWVGLTIAQAQQQYGRRQVVELQRSRHNLPTAQITDDLTGFCKLVGHRNGTLLGAHLVGAQAGEAIALLALAMQQRLKMSAIAQLIPPTFTLAELVQQTATDFRRDYFHQHPWQQDAIDTFFDLRRAWSRNPHK